MRANGCPDDREQTDAVVSMTATSDEQELVMRLRAGDTKALEILMHPYAAGLEDYAYLTVHTDGSGRI